MYQKTEIQQTWFNVVQWNIFLEIKILRYTRTMGELKTAKISKTLCHVFEKKTKHPVHRCFKGIPITLRGKADQGRILNIH